MNTLLKMLEVLFLGSVMVATLRLMLWFCKDVLNEKTGTNAAPDFLSLIFKLTAVVVPFGATSIGLAYLLYLGLVQ